MDAPRMPGGLPADSGGPMNTTTTIALSIAAALGDDGTTYETASGLQAVAS